MANATDAEGSNRLPPKDDYDELSDTQQAVVDAILDDPDATSDQIAERADVSPGYVRSIWGAYSHILADRQADRDRDVLAQITEDTGPEWAFFDADTGEPERVTISLTRVDVSALLDGTVPETFREALLDRVLDRAFGRAELEHAE